MKRAIFVPMVVLIAVSLACTVFAPAAPPTPQPAVVVETPKQVVAEKATEAPPPVVPTNTEAPVEVPTEKVELPTPTDAPTNTPEGPTVYSETFDRRNDNWSDMLVVTSQASGRDPYIKITVDSGVMRFAVQDKETYVYRFFKDTGRGDGTIEINYEPRGAQNNGIAVVCMANQEMTEWYEVRLLSGMSEYNFYHYSKRLRTEEGKNPYILLGRGRLAAKEFSPGKGNPFSVTCNNEDLTVDVNNGKRVESVPVDVALDGTLIGIGVMSYDVIPMTIDFDSVVITQEK